MSERTNEDKLRILQERLAQIQEKKEHIKKIKLKTKNTSLLQLRKIL